MTYEDDDLFNNMFAEVDLLKFVKHKNIVKYIEFFQDANNFYLVTEYLVKQDLQIYMRDKFLNITQKLQIIREICNGVSFLHSIRYMHRVQTF